MPVLFNFSSGEKQGIKQDENQALSKVVVFTGATQLCGRADRLISHWSHEIYRSTF